MRVLIVPKWYPWPDRPVFGIFCQEQARALAARHDVTVLASDPVRRPGFLLYELSEAVEGGVRTLRLRYRRPAFRPLAMVCQMIGMMVALYRLRRRGWRPEIVHAHVYSAGLPAVILGRLSRAPVVITEHYTGFQRGLITGYDRLTAQLAFGLADLVAPVSHDLARHVRAIQPRARIRVVDNVVDTTVFHPPVDAPAGVRDGSARLLTVGVLARKKGHADLLEAMAELRGRSQLTLDLVGEGPLRGELLERVRRLDLEQAVRFHGEQPKHQVAELMRQADLFVLPSHFENLPCVLIEAMASGLRFVATAVGDVPELAAVGVGVLCPARDPGALAAAINDALGLDEQVDREALATRTELRFGYEAFASSWTAIYAELRSGRDSIT